MSDQKPAQPFKYRPINPYCIFLRLLEPEVVFSGLSRTLGPIGKTIQECGAIIEEAVSSGNEDYREIVTDEECEIIENLLGTAFVICQTHITTVVSRVKELHEFFQKREGRGLNLETSKLAILERGAELIPRTGISYVVAIDSLANYFKHRDEWPRDWVNLSGLPARTRDIVTALGVEPTSTGNLRAGARTLGNPEFHAVAKFAERLVVWEGRLRHAYKEQLEIERVI